MQVLAGGKIQLLKITKVKLVKREADPLLKTTENSFESWESYFIEENGNTHELRKISKGRLFDLLKMEDGDEDWLHAQKNKLNNETDVIAFLNYRNTAHK
jgi:hypothetical protein